MLKTLKNCIFFSSFSPYGVHMIKVRARKAINELVLVLILIAIAVPVLFAIQTWLSSQVSKLPSAPQATASYSVSYSQNNTILTIKVTNQYADKSLNVTGIRITYIPSSGGSPSVQTSLSSSSTPFALRDPTSLNPSSLGPKSDRYYVITAAGAITVIDVAIEFRDTTTGAIFEIKSVGGTAV
jgi:hypothetical protein